MACLPTRIGLRKRSHNSNNSNHSGNNNNINMNYNNNNNNNNMVLWMIFSSSLLTVLNHFHSHCFVSSFQHQLSNCCPMSRRTTTSSFTSSSSSLTSVVQQHFLSQPSALSMTTSRRDFFGTPTTSVVVVSTLMLGLSLPPPAAIAVDDKVTSSSSFSTLVMQIKEARALMDTIPVLIEHEQWDAVRAVLLKAPLIDCWAKTNRPLLLNYAQALGNTETGDELAALEAKEDVISHLRYLDMAVYNNVFNPIKAEGTNGATKELIRSYYEDPTNEWKASVKALDELIELGQQQQQQP